MGHHTDHVQPAQEFIFLLLMCGWLSYVKFEKGSGWTVVDLFCGKARISKLAAALGLKTASVDVRLPGRFNRQRRSNRTRFPKRNMMDFNGHVGFPFLSYKQPLFLSHCGGHHQVGFPAAFPWGVSWCSGSS